MPNPKKININLLDVKQSGSFTRNDWNTLYDLYTIEGKDIIFTSKTKTLKDSNNQHYEWTHLSFNGIINGEQKDPKMPKNSNYATKADIKEIKDSLKNYATKEDVQVITNDIQEIKDSLKNYATKDDIQEIKDSLKNYATKDDINRITNDIQEIKNVLTNLTVSVNLIINSIGEIKNDIALIKQCPTIKKELNGN